MKCQICKEEVAEWSWQPFGPNETPDSYVTLGSHARGFPVIKVGDTCKRAFQSGDFEVRFDYKGYRYLGKDHKVTEISPNLWIGDTHKPSELNDSSVQAIMRDTFKGGPDIAALVYVDNADLLQSFVIAPQLVEACTELDKFYKQIYGYLDFTYVSKQDRDSIMLILAKIHNELERIRKPK